MITPANTDINNIIMTNKLKKALKKKNKYLPPLTLERQIIFENKPNSLISQFCNNISNDIINITNSTLKPIYEARRKKLGLTSPLKTENNKSQNDKNENKVNNSPFLTEANINNNMQSTNNLSSLMNVDISVPNSLSLTHTLNSRKKQKLDKFYRRIRTYQPHIDSNWKYKNGLSTNSGSKLGIIPALMNNIEFQTKVIHDNVRLLMDNVGYYTMTIIPRENFIKAFKSLTIYSQASYNKSLEEAIGIFLLLPQLILLEFYQFIENFNSVSVPNRKQFKEKYIFDEVECLYNNNNLLNRVTEFFTKCFDVYLTLVKEVDGMLLKPKQFENVITILERGRFDISKIISSGENAMRLYENDLKLIDKVIKTEHASENEEDNNKYKFEAPKKMNLTDKLRAQFLFKKNEERQRIIRINNALKVENDDYDIYDEETIKKEHTENKDKFKTIINSKLMNDLLDYMRKGVKEQIKDRRIENDIEGIPKLEI